MLFYHRDIFAPDAVLHRMCHAPTISITPDGDLIVCWFGGRCEASIDTGIWSALLRRDNLNWLPPVEITSQIRHLIPLKPVWNPVLFLNKVTSELLLFFKIGDNPDDWQNLVMISRDGINWNLSPWSSKLTGPTKNPPIQFENGDWIFPSSREYRNKWEIVIERYDATAKKIVVVVIEADPEIMAIQPFLLIYPNGRIQALCRTRNQFIYQTFSSDGGKTWGKLIATQIPNPNSAICGTTLQDGRQLMVYNNTQLGRSQLTVALSENGIDWHSQHILEDKKGEYSYPAVVQTPDKLIHVVYTANRRTIRHVQISL